MPEQDRVPQVSTGGTYSEEEARKYIFVLGNQLRVEKSYVEYYKQRVERLTRERDEARAEVEKERAYADASNQDAVAAEARLAKVVEALQALLDAMCGPTGFSTAVRMTTGTAFPWPAEESAEAKARAALAAAKGE